MDLFVHWKSRFFVFRTMDEEYGGNQNGDEAIDTEELSKKIDDLKNMVTQLYGTISMIHRKQELMDTEMKAMKADSENPNVTDRRHSKLRASLGYALKDDSTDPLETPTRSRQNVPLKETSPLSGGGAVQASQVVTTVIVEPFKLKDDEKMKTISYRSVLKFLEKYRVYQHESLDKSRKLWYFIGQDLLRLLVDNEVRLSTDLSLGLTYSTVYDISDVKLMGVLARYLRPLTTKEYTQQLYKTVQVVSVKGDWKFQIGDYDTMLHAPVMKMCQEAKEFDELVRLTATPEEISRLPAINYGKDTKPGVIRLFMKLFGVFEANFLALLKEEELKKIDSLEAFKESVKKVNNDQATKAKALRIAEAESAPPEKVGDTYNSIVNKTSQNDPTKILQRPRQAYERPGLPGLRVIDSKTEARTNYDWTQGHHSYEAYSDDEDNSASIALVNKSYGGNTRNSQDIRIYKDKPQEKTLPCFIYFNTGNCPDGKSCIYGHGEKEMETHAESIAKQINSSPYKQLVHKYLRTSVISFQSNPMYKTPGGTPTGKPYIKPAIKSIEEMQGIESRDNVFDESMSYGEEQDDNLNMISYDIVDDIKVDKLGRKLHEQLSDLMSASLPSNMKFTAAQCLGYVLLGSLIVRVPKVTLDTGASSGSYAGEALLNRLLPNVTFLRGFKHRVKLADGVTYLTLDKAIEVELKLESNGLAPLGGHKIVLYIVPKLGDEVIIGLPHLLGPFYEFLIQLLEQARHKKISFDRESNLSMIVEEDLSQPVTCPGKFYQNWTTRHSCGEAMFRLDPNGLVHTMGQEVADRLPTRCRVHMRDGNYKIDICWSIEPPYTSQTRRHDTFFNVDAGLGDLVIVGCNRRRFRGHDETFISVIEEREKLAEAEHDRREYESAARSLTESTIPASASVATVEDAVDSGPSDAPEPAPLDGTILEPWSLPREEVPEEVATPYPCSLSDDAMIIIGYLGDVTEEQAREDYMRQLKEHITPEMIKEVPEILDLMMSDIAVTTFVPGTWEGLDIPPVDFKIVGILPSSMKAKARPIPHQLLPSAKKEMTRMCQYMYLSSNSPIASPLVIAPKATDPFIRICGDYRPINPFLQIPRETIPIVKNELAKLTNYKYYADLDMTNSFHQIPLSDQASNLLSVSTPWGLFRPRFMPEGVGPASMVLQSIVREIFKDFDEWIVVIFDNFLILAHSYRDVYNKLKMVLERCQQYRMVLKIKKSWIGVTKTTFFGFEIGDGKYGLSQDRKNAIMAMRMPTNAKEMQSFLGAALFFQSHVPNYSEWAARLYQMTHTSFNWNPETWSFDYVSYFEEFKNVLLKAMFLHFPDFSLDWILRPDASNFAVGAVLFQLRDGKPEPINFVHTRLSKPAMNWDTYKKEAYACYFAIMSCQFLLKGKSFLLETDHRNLQWIENSLAPIVIRWRALMQSYVFLIKHISATENKLADWLSRYAYDPPALASLFGTDKGMPDEYSIYELFGNDKQNVIQLSSDGVVYVIRSTGNEEDTVDLAVVEEESNSAALHQSDTPPPLLTDTDSDDDMTSSDELTSNVQRSHNLLTHRADERQRVIAQARLDFHRHSSLYVTSPSSINIPIIRLANGRRVGDYRALNSLVRFGNNIRPRGNALADVLSRSATLESTPNIRDLGKRIRVPYEPEPVNPHMPRRSRDDDDDDDFPSLMPVQEAPILVADVIKNVHGGRSFHPGVRQTWERVKKAYPTVPISIRQVQDYINECAICQKNRNTGVSSLPEMIRSLKPDHYRRRVGVDHVTVTPRDELGNGCIVLIVEHFAHFPQCWPAPDYSSETTAIALFKHFCTFGLFDELISDPGSAFMSDVVKHLNHYLGIRHVVSLVERHESNGCECTSREVLRHLTTLVQDEEVKKKWSHDTVLPIINFELASYPTSETGGYTPFELKYGSDDAPYFRLPNDLAPGSANVPLLIQQLNENIRHIRSLSLALQTQIKDKRSNSTPVPTYEPGDFVLWNPKEHPNAHLDSKLSPAFKGPFEVKTHIKNDVLCEHVVNKTQHTFHVTRLKPFFGTRVDAERVAAADDDQVIVKKIHRYTGNPHVRTSMVFVVEFIDGDIRELQYNPDLARNEIFISYVHSEPYLFPLQSTAVESKRTVQHLRATRIVTIALGNSRFLSLRFWDGQDSSWYDSLPHMDLHITHYVEIKFIRWYNRKESKVIGYVSVFDSHYILDNYDIQTVTLPLLPDPAILITASLLSTFPYLKPL